MRTRTRSLLVTVLLLAVAGPLGAQRIRDLAPRQAPRPKPLSTDGVALQVEDAVVTLVELNQRIEDGLKRQPVSTPDDYSELVRLTIRQLVLDLLEPQAGGELGLNDQQLDIIVSSQLEDRRKEVGIGAYTEELRSQGMDAFSAGEVEREGILTAMWRRKQIGLSVADQRPSVDRYVRPGELHAIYRAMRDELAPPRVRFEILVVTASASGGPDLALALCEEAQERIEAGEPFADLVEVYGADLGLRRTGGLTPELLVPAIGDPRLKALAQGEVGVLSDPMPLLTENGPDPTQGYQLVRLAERESPPPPRFDDPQTQARLRNFVSGRRDNERIMRAQERLGGRSFIWINPALEGVGPTGPQGPR